MQSFYLPDEDAFIRYLDIPGREPARVFIHGLSSASTADYPEIVAQSPLAGHRSLLVDLLGFGYSDSPPAFGYTLEETPGVWRNCWMAWA